MSRNIEKNSLAIIDELGRGTSTRDGLAIALSIAEALVDSGAMIYFATHFRELGKAKDTQSRTATDFIQLKSCKSATAWLTSISRST